jgi:hypothetical protein
MEEFFAYYLAEDKATLIICPHIGSHNTVCIKSRKEPKLKPVMQNAPQVTLTEALEWLNEHVFGQDETPCQTRHAELDSASPSQSRDSKETLNQVQDDSPA